MDPATLSLKIVETIYADLKDQKLICPELTEQSAAKLKLEWMTKVLSLIGE